MEVPWEQEVIPVDAAAAAGSSSTSRYVCLSTCLASPLSLSPSLTYLPTCLPCLSPLSQPLTYLPTYLSTHIYRLSTPLNKDVHSGLVLRLLTSSGNTGAGASQAPTIAGGGATTPVDLEIPLLVKPSKRPTVLMVYQVGR